MQVLTFNQNVHKHNFVVDVISDYSIKVIQYVQTTIARSNFSQSQTMPLALLGITFHLKYKQIMFSLVLNKMLMFGY